MFWLCRWWRFSFGSDCIMRLLFLKITEVCLFWKVTNGLLTWKSRRSCFLGSHGKGFSFRDLLLAVMKVLLLGSNGERFFFWRSRLRFCFWKSRRRFCRDRGDLIWRSRRLLREITEICFGDHGDLIWRSWRFALEITGIFFGDHGVFFWRSRRSA